MSIYSIYKIVNNINGKIYIGFSRNVEKRICDHIQQSKKSNLKLYNAIRKYGWSNFSFEVLYQSKDANHTLNDMERHFIEEYDSFRHGYNCTAGGEGLLGYKHSSITKQKMQKPKSESHKLKLKVARNKRKVEPALGKRWTEERRQKIIKSRKGVSNEKNYKRIKTPDGIFESVTKAAEHYGHNIHYMSRKIKNNPKLFEFI